MIKKIILTLTIGLVLSFTSCGGSGKDNSSVPVTQEENNSSVPVTQRNSDSFITTWKTDNEGNSSNNQINIPTNNEYSYRYAVDWGDGTTTEDITGDITHTYDTAGIYSIEISGVFPHFYNSSDGTDRTREDSDARKLLSVEQWGTNNWLSMKSTFNECENMVMNAVDVPQLRKVTTMESMFSNTRDFNQDISTWDVSNVTDMRGMFNTSSFNQDIGTWNVSNVTDMNFMFNWAIAFNQDISTWDVSKVTNMSFMFNSCPFNQDISTWNVDKVINMGYMFYNSPFNQNIDIWNFERVTNMGFMFFASHLSTANYDALLISLHNQSLQRNVDFDAGQSKYSSAGADAKNVLISKFSWNIIDGGSE